MTNWQFYLVMGVPSLAVLIGLIVNRMWWSATNSRIDARFTETIDRIDRLKFRSLQIQTDMKQFNRDRIRNGRA